jgi:sulfotransferase family protein
VAQRPVFVVGFQRSGTTLLQSLLGAHRRIAAPPELHFILRVAYFADYFGDLADDGNLRRALHEALNPPVDILAECGFDEHALFERAAAGPRTYAALLAAIMDDYAERNGKQRWAEKTPSQRADDIYNLFPDALVVHIMRDAREVVASSLDMPWERRRAAAIATDLRHFTLESVERGRRAGAAQYLQVRYEDLARQPEAVLRQVCAFIGEDYDPGMVDPERGGQALMPAATWQAQAARAIAPVESKWRAKLGPADRVRVQAIVRDLLAPYGYAPPSKAVRRLMPLASAEVRVRALVPSAVARARRPKTPEARYRAVRALMQSAADGVGAAAR